LSFEGIRGRLRGALLDIRRQEKVVSSRPIQREIKRERFCGEITFRDRKVDQIQKKTRCVISYEGFAIVWNVWEKL